eukprot:gene1939-2117_t
MSFGRSVVFLSLSAGRNAHRTVSALRPSASMTIGRQMLSASSSVRAMATSAKKQDEVVHEEDLDEIVSKLDLTLTPEQKAYVEGLKKIMKGAHSPHSIYRDVPYPEEIVTEGNFLPKMAPNPEALIDWALSHIPKRDGPRGTRQKKRMAKRAAQRVANHARRKAEQVASKLRRDAKLKRIRTEIKAIRAEAEQIAKLNELRQQVREAKKKATEKV